MNSLEQLRQYTTVVADTGDFHLLSRLRPQDATTNPSLVLKAARKPEYRALLEHTVHTYRHLPVDALMDRLVVAFGLEILNVIPGRVSTEVDARLSFDTARTISRAQSIAQLYEQAGVGRERVLIKIASTWEGIEAARVLESEGIRCNLTLLFSLVQAVACADAGVQLISPFVGRITDWHKKREGRDFLPDEDPGVVSVRRIYAYFKPRGVRTEIMGASFRTPQQVLALAGCDLLTISPDLLDQLSAMNTVVPRCLPAAQAFAQPDICADEANFRWLLNEDAMATEKLAEGIRTFAADALELEHLVASL